MLADVEGEYKGSKQRVNKEHQGSFEPSPVCRMAATPETIQGRTSISPPSLAMANHKQQGSTSRLPSFAKPRKSTPTQGSTTSTTPSRPPRSRPPTQPVAAPQLPATPLKVIAPSPDPESARERAISLQFQRT